MAVNSYKDDENISSESNIKTIGRLFSYMGKYKLMLALVILTLTITVGISLINPLIIQAIIDGPVKQKDMSGLFKLGIFALVLNLVYALLIKLRLYTMSKVTNRILCDIREELYIHIQQLSFTFFDSRPTGKILSRIIGDVNSLKEVLTNSVMTLLPGIATVIGVFIIMLKKNVILTLATLCSIPLMIAGVAFIQGFCHKMWMNYRQKNSNLSAFIHENMSGISIVQAFSAEREMKKRFDVVNTDVEKSFSSAVRLADLFYPTSSISWGIGTMVMYLVGIKVLGSDNISVGLLVAFSSYSSMFWTPITNICNFYNQVVMALSAAKRIFDVLDTEPDIVDQDDVTELPSIEGKVTFKNVSFTYDIGTEAETKVLNNVSFTVKPGETIALVGPTGAGKTTIVNLISRFYDIQSGHILVDDSDITQVSISSLRSQMGVMTQDNFIFQGTIRENIMYGKLDASEEEMLAAAKAVNAHEFICKLENGYDTVLGNSGIDLSIGQKQLIAFARTMISQPRILILDEATSNIDTHTEMLVQKGIAALLEGRTSFVIAHRLSTIQNADRIFVIDNGGIVESGSPTELLAQKGAYYNLYMAQFDDIA